MQIAGVDRSRLHTDQRLAGSWCGNGPGFQPQDIDRLADLSGYERAHGSRHERPFISQRPASSTGVTDKNDAGAGFLVGARAAGPSFLMEPARVLSVIGTGSLLPFTGPLETIT
ncbi:hypothetical protein GCM10022207_56780 [Streptomyces lannensis]|uniref:Uncharacterized protein n=1 Tax=Streptomyces lannensis TaxID=766498 RepID=A0ABP7KM80_9ACTN